MAKKNTAQRVEGGVIKTLSDIFNPFSGGAGPLSKNAPKEGTSFEQLRTGNLDAVAGSPGSESAGSEHRAGVTYDPDTLIKTYFPDLTGDQITAVRQQLAPYEAQGGPEYHKALTALASSTPGLSQHSALNKAFADKSQSQAAIDPLAQQMFLFQTIAPYLDKIRGETQSMTAPLYQQAMSRLPANMHAQFAPLLQAMQGSEGGLQGALSAATVAAPSLDQLMQNVSAARSASLKDYYEQLAAKSSGGSSGGGLAGLQALLGGNTGG